MIEERYLASKVETLEAVRDFFRALIGLINIVTPAIQAAIAADKDRRSRGVR